MDIQTLLTVAGIVVTVAFGIWAIVVTIRFNRSVQITYVHDQAIALVDDISQHFQDLRISFRNAPVSENLVLLKGYLVNTGNKDISPEMVEDAITFWLPEDFEWLEFKVVECSPQMRAKTSILNAHAIRFETGLWNMRAH